MKLVSFSSADSASLRQGALLPQGDVLDFQAPAAELPRPDSALAWCDLEGAALQRAAALCRAIADDPGERERLHRDGALLPLAEIRLAAPVPRPGKVICIGLNYRDHAEESGMEIPDRPLLFSKFPSCVIGPGEPVRIPQGSAETDYEAELAVIIGRRSWRVGVDEAWDSVLGYTNFNDVSARDFQFTDGQWQRGKSCDGFAPCGPYVATRDEIPDPHRLSIKLQLNGSTMQDSRTDQLVFGVPQLVSAISEHISLEPGDLIATGTPPGVGFARKPPVYLQPGDRVEVEIEGLGVLENPVVASDA